jgi:hypothetical protein
VEDVPLEVGEPFELRAQIGGEQWGHGLSLLHARPDEAGTLVIGNVRMHESRRLGILEGR